MLNTHARRHRASTSTALLAVLCLPFIFVSPARAAAVPVELQFTTTINASPAGGPADSVLRITYRFDPTLAPGTGPFGADTNFASYGPLERVILEVGDECAALMGPGTAITTFNDTSGTGTEDSFDVRGDRPAVTGKQLFGYDLSFFRFLLVDNEGTMFSDTSLPTTTGFEAAADFHQTTVNLMGPDGRPFGLNADSAGAFQLASYAPEQTISALEQQVVNLQLARSLNKSLLETLAKAKKFFTDTNVTNDEKAIPLINSFVAKVSSQSGKGISAADASTLVTGATNLLNDLPACL